MSTLFGVISSLITLYMFVIVFRILMSWFPGSDFGRAQYYLRAATDPYLNFFRRAQFLRVGYVDLSPILAIITLSVASFVFNALATAGTVTLGMVLSLIVAQIVSAAAFIAGLFTIIMAVRAVAITMGARGDRRIWMTLDQLLQPVTYKVVAKLARDRFFTYRNALLIMIGFGIVTVLALNIGGNALALLLQRIPI
ncbi:MAG: YggT family protein [Spirochaetales bacterium]